MSDITCEITKDPANSRIFIISNLHYSTIEEPAYAVPAIMVASKTFNIASINNQSGVLEPPLDSSTGQPIVNSSFGFTSGANSTSIPRFSMYYRTASSELVNIGFNAEFYPIP
jgi:hypothetical protein